MGEIVGGWDRQDVARAQWSLVRQELKADPATIGPYAAFQWAMDIIGLKDATLLDVGCGVGHYAILCKRLYPDIRYHGTDISQAMIDQARQIAPLATFSVCDFKDNAFEDYDIILAGQVVEQLDNPPASLDLLLTLARRYIILNRIRLTHAAESHRIEETTYCGNMGRTWLWNREDIIQRIEEYAQIVAVNDWATDQVTFVVKRREENDQPAELCGCANACTGACSCACT